MTTPKFKTFKNNWLVLRDCVIAIICGIVLGFIVDFIFPYPKKNENFWLALFLVILQLTVCSFIVYYYGELFAYFFGEEDSDDYRGFTVFGVLFFIVQVQLLYRLNILFKSLTGRNFD